MTGWLVRATHIRAVELVGEFLRRAAETTVPAEAFRLSCDSARQIFEADSVILWRLGATRDFLTAVAASPPPEEFFGELAVDALPHGREVLAEGTPRWVQLVGEDKHPSFSPLIDARCALLVPVVAQGSARGCFLCLFARATTAPAPEDLEAGLALGGAVGQMLAVETLARERSAQQQRRNAGRGLARQFDRWGWSEAGLGRLTAAARELCGAEAVGVYERQPAAYARIAVAGAAHLLPAELPRSLAEAVPGAGASADSGAAGEMGGEGSALLKASFPHWPHTRLRLLPLRSKETPLGAVLLREAPGTARQASEELEGNLLSLLAAGLENRRLERHCLERQRRHQALFEHTAEGAFYLDAAGRLLTANPLLLARTGHSLEELRKGSLTDFLSADEREPLRAWLEARPQQDYGGGVRWRTRAGGWWPAELTLHALPAAPPGQAAVLGLAREASRQPEPDNPAQLSQAWLQGVLDSSNDGVWVIAADGRVALANHRLSQLLGVSLQVLGPGASHADVLTRLKSQFHSPEAVLARWRQIQESPDEVCWDELELLQPRRRILERFARPLFDGENRFAGRLEIYRDITGQRLLEDKIVEREKLATVGRIVSGVAHELNNPLTAVAGYAQLLLVGRLPPELQDMARRLHREAERAGRIVKNLLLYARGDEAEKQTVDLAEILEHTLSLRAYELKVNNIRVVRRYARKAPPAWANPHQLQQVFLNLLINAEQAIRSRRDHGRMKISLLGRQGQDRVRVEVSDDGPGIPAALLPYIFDPFFTTKPRQKGTGLGLSVSHAIIEEHGGRLFAESATGRGVTFIVDLPARPQPPRRDRDRPARRRPEAAETNGRRILVVDDEPEVGRLIADVLGQLHYTVRVYTESPRALAEALRQPFHLVICDIRMPELDGQGFHRALREQQSPLARRILFTTGDTLAPETAAFLKQVQLPYLAKPFHVEELRGMVRTVLLDLDRSARSGKEPGQWRNRHVGEGAG
ncbi:MAG: ATP-binding protein [Terriglobia bacterium]